MKAKYSEAKYRHQIIIHPRAAKAQRPQYVALASFFAK